MCAPSCLGDGNRASPELRTILVETRPGQGAQPPRAHDECGFTKKVKLTAAQEVTTGRGPIANAQAREGETTVDVSTRSSAHPKPTSQPKTTFQTQPSQQPRHRATAQQPPQLDAPVLHLLFKAPPTLPRTRRVYRARFVIPATMRPMVMYLEPAECNRASRLFRGRACGLWGCQSVTTSHLISDARNKA